MIILTMIFVDIASLVPAEISARGHLAIKAYNKAVQEGKTRVIRVPVMFIGQARSGKTSLKKSLKGEKFNDKEPSTDGIERDPSYFSVTNEIMSLEETGEDLDVESAVSFNNRVAQIMAHEMKGSGEQSDAKNDNVAQPEGNMAEWTEEQSVKLFETDKESRSDNRFEEVPEKTAVCFEKIVNESSKENEDKVFFTLWDFGGQSVYYATHPIFLTGKAIYLLVYDLSKDPEGIADPIEKQGVFNRKEDSDCRKTNQDYLHFWLSSVSALEIQTEGQSESSGSQKMPKKLPPVILACTHADQAGSKGSAKETSLKIYGSLRHKLFSKHLYKKYFVVDNTKSGSQDECEDVQKLKGELQALAKQLPYMQQTIPIRWVAFEEALKDMLAKGEPFISLDVARKVARDECEIYDDEQFETALTFLHDQRILIHFHETQELKDIVILDPQWLIDLFRKVITVKPYHPVSDEEQFEELWERLEKEGILDDELIEIVWSPFLNKKTKDSLIAIMEKFSLLCRLPKQEEGKQLYLVPSMLMSLSETAVDELLEDAPILPLFIQFRKPFGSKVEYVQMPLGFFPRLLVKFLKLCIDKKNTPLYWSMYQNFARFPIGPRGYSVILRCHSFSLQILVYRDPKISSHEWDVDVCDSVLEQLETMLQSLREECFWLNTIRYEFRVICPVCCEQRSGKFSSKGFKEDEFLHSWSESELQDEQARICRKHTLAKEEMVPVERFAFWFRSLRKQVNK